MSTPGGAEPVERGCPGEKGRAGSKPLRNLPPSALSWWGPLPATPDSCASEPQSRGAAHVETDGSRDRRSAWFSREHPPQGRAGGLSPRWAGLRGGRRKSWAPAGDHMTARPSSPGSRRRPLPTVGGREAEGGRAGARWRARTSNLQRGFGLDASGPRPGGPSRPLSQRRSCGWRGSVLRSTRVGRCEFSVSYEAATRGMVSGRRVP